MKDLPKLLLISLLILGILVLGQPFENVAGQDVTSTPTTPLTNTPTDLPSPPTDPPTNTPESTVTATDVPPSPTETDMPTAIHTATATDTLTPTEVAWTTYADTQADIDYRGGTWTVQPDSQAMQGTTTVSSAENAQMTVRFKGTGIILLYVANPAGGFFQGQLDNLAPLSVNAQATNNSYQTQLAFNDLPNGDHTLVITNQAGMLIVEALQIQGEILPSRLPPVSPSPTEDSRLYTFCHVTGNNPATANYILMEDQPYSALNGHFNADGTPANGHPLDFIIAGPDVPLSGLGIEDCASPTQPTTSSTPSLTPSPSSSPIITATPDDTPTPEATDEISIEKIIPTGPDPALTAPPTNTPTATPTITLTPLPTTCPATFDVLDGDTAYLIEAIICANARRPQATIINLAIGGTYIFTQPYSGNKALPNVRGNITLEGNGSILTITSAMGLTKVDNDPQEHHCASLTLNNLIFDGAELDAISTLGVNFVSCGTDPVTGANRHATLTLNHSIIQNIVSPRLNARVIDSAGVVIFNNSVIRDIDFSYSGLITHISHAISGGRVSLTIRNSRFENITSIKGAAIIGSSAHTTIENSVFSNNQTDEDGMIEIGADQPVSITHSVFQNNQITNEDHGTVVNVGGGDLEPILYVNDNCFINNLPLTNPVIRNMNSSTTVNAANNGWYPAEITDGNVTTGGGAPSWCGPDQEPPTTLVVNAQWADDYGASLINSSVGISAAPAYVGAVLSNGSATHAYNDPVSVTIEENTNVSLEMTGFDFINLAYHNRVRVGLKQINNIVVSAVEEPPEGDGYYWYWLSDVTRTGGLLMNLPAAGVSNNYAVTLEVALCRADNLAPVPLELQGLPSCGLSNTLTLNYTWGDAYGVTLDDTDAQVSFNGATWTRTISGDTTGPMVYPTSISAPASTKLREIADIPSQYWNEVQVGLYQSTGNAPLAVQAPPETYWYTLADADSVAEMALNLGFPDANGNYEAGIIVYLCHDTSATAATLPVTQNATVALLIFMLSGSLVGVAVVLRHKERQIPAVGCVLLAIGVMVGGGFMLGGSPTTVEAYVFDINALPICSQVVASTPTPVPPTYTLSPTTTPVPTVDPILTCPEQSKPKLSDLVVDVSDPNHETYRQQVRQILLSELRNSGNCGVQILDNMRRKGQAEAELAITILGEVAAGTPNFVAAGPWAPPENYALAYNLGGLST